MAANEIVDDEDIDGIHWPVSDPVAADLMRPECLSGEQVRIQAALAHASQPA